MNVETAYAADHVSLERLYVLPKSVSAIPILPSEESGSKRLGLLTQLPEGAEIEISGPGFNFTTLQVRCGATFYYVFLDDLDLVRKHAAYA